MVSSLFTSSENFKPIKQDFDFFVGSGRKNVRLKFEFRSQKAMSEQPVIIVTRLLRSSRRESKQKEKL